VSIFVVDASVVIKWFIPEIHSDAARHLLKQDHEFLAPDLLFAEIANTIWKKVQRRELSQVQGLQLMKDFAGVAVHTVPCRALALDAYSLAIAAGCTAYDAMYLALAIRLNTQVITADERLARALAAIPATAPHIQTVQNFQEP
jgi:predicted nucleic acid-binding protein